MHPRISEPTPVKTGSFMLETPSELKNRWKLKDCQAFGIFGIKCVDTDLYLRYPQQINFGSGVYNFDYADLDVFGNSLLYDRHYQLSGGSPDGTELYQTLDLDGVPAEDILHRNEPIEVIVTFVYCTAEFTPCEVGFKTVDVKLHLFLTVGYNKTVI
jgi:hypothetical protein